GRRPRHRERRRDRGRPHHRGPRRHGRESVLDRSLREARERVLHHGLFDHRGPRLHRARRGDEQRQLRGPHRRAFQAFQGRDREARRTRGRRLGAPAGRHGGRRRARGRGLRGHQRRAAGRGRARPASEVFPRRAERAATRPARVERPGMSAQPTTQPTTQPTAQPTTPATKQTVPLLDLTAQFKSIESEIRGAIDRVVTSGRYIGGPEVSEFEKEVGAYCQVPHAIACASGTDALILAMRALGVGSGDEVITPAYSFLASASAVALVGGKPVFVDVEPDTYNIDPTKVERAITPRTKAVIVVHLFGQCADLEAVQAVCKRHRLPLVEDAAQAIGAECKGRRAGSWGDIRSFSFFPSKHLGACGGGGLVVSTQAALGDKLRLLREHGAKPKYNHIELGMNSRLDALQAAVLRVKLRHLESWTEGRRRNADLYRERLA